MDATELREIKHQIMQRYRDGVGGAVWGLGIDFHYLLDQSPICSTSLRSSTSGG
ncbi:MAG TPA: hypothetical protein VFL91_14600 [Thermomicrobiales bacterium]|nr:hypothetical protein [Thermomicrobiales bacterium]